MPIQTLLRGKIVLPPPITTDKDLLELYRNYTQLSQQVNLMQRGIMQFPVAISNGLTTKAVTFPIPTRTTGYVVAGSPEFNAGAWFVTSKTITGCTLTWATASVGAQQFTLLVVE